MLEIMDIATGRRLPGIAHDRPPEPGVLVERDVVIVARDGIRLRVDIYHPADWNEVAYPALLAVSAYQKATAGLPVVPMYPFRETGPIEWYVKRGYVYVLADVRGTGTSDGRFSLHSEAEQHDLYDMIEWIASQSWCTSKVGMIGQSYYGLIQWLAAAQQPPHLACIAPYDALVDHYRDSLLHGGILCTFSSEWDRVLRGNHVWGPGSDRPLRFDTNPFDAALQHPLDDDFWQERQVFERLPEITIPVLSIGNWGKNSIHVRGNILGYERVSGVKQLRMEAGARVPAMNVSQALLAFESIELHEKLLAPWYDYWLRGIDNGVLDQPEVSLYISGVDEDRSYDSWPPAEAVDVEFHLTAGEEPPRFSVNDGLLAPGAPRGATSTSYTYPDPHWHIGTATVTSLGVPNPVSRILTFATSPLAEDTEVIGCARLVLYVSSDQPDSDFIVRVTDVSPRSDGLDPELPTPARTVTKGWLKASHRELDPRHTTARRPYHSHRRELAMELGAVYRLEIELMPLAHVFRAGHQIRLEISNGDSPVTDPAFWHFYGIKKGTDTIHHDAVHDSALILPLTKGAASWRAGALGSVERTAVHAG